MNPYNTLEKFRKEVDDGTSYKLGHWYNEVFAKNRLSEFRAYGMGCNLWPLYRWESKERYFKWLDRKLLIKLKQSVRPVVKGLY